jgi:metal-dependent amidase/aminoacylase/carboxypeptidase family protein
LLRQADSETPVSPSGSEDFSTFTNVISGCFVFVNGGDADDRLPDVNYHPTFNLFQSSLAAGVKTEVRIVLDVLGVG